MLDLEGHFIDVFLAVLVNESRQFHLCGIFSEIIHNKIEKKIHKSRILCVIYIITKNFDVFKFMFYNMFYFFNFTFINH